MPEKEEQAHSMCVSLRLDPATLKELNEERKEETLSAAMNVRICGALSVLASHANRERQEK